MIMKKVPVLVAMLLLTAIAFGQSEKYQKSMTASKALLDSAKTPADYNAVAATFERIAEAEKTQWLPYYYAALANILGGFNNPEGNKDEIANKADALLAKAEALDSKNSEINVVKSMSATLHMLVDPMSRWQKYGGMQREALETAKQFNAENPRIYYLEGQTLFNTPPQFGGGKDKAKPLFEKSLALYKKQKPATPLDPSWGENVTQKMFDSCK